MHVFELMADDFDIERLTTASIANPVRLWNEQQERFESDFKDRKPTPPRKPWKYGYWVDGEYAVWLIIRSYLNHLDEDFELFYDQAYPNEWGGWMFMTDWAAPAHTR